MECINSPTPLDKCIQAPDNIPQSSNPVKPEYQDISHVARSVEMTPDGLMNCRLTEIMPERKLRRIFLKSKISKKQYLLRKLR